MTADNWDAEHATAVPPVPEDEPDAPASAYRYGVTSWESSHPEPLSVALAQELPDESSEDDENDDWREVDEDGAFPGRLLADEGVADDDYALAVDDAEDYAAEELAMHIVEQ